MNDLVPFSFESAPIRVVDQGGQPWFVASDICAVLEIANVGNALTRLLDNERNSIRNPDVNRGRGNPDLTVINESGMWKLVLRSRKPEAERLITWLTSKVLPSLRRTGQYGSPAPELDLRDPAVLHRLLLDHTSNAMEAEARVAALAPKAEALDQIANAQGSLCITDAAKAMGVQPRRLFSWLEANHWTYRRGDGGAWVAYQAKIDSGMLEHKGNRLTRPGMPDKLIEQVVVTPKGLTRLATLKAGA